MTKRNRASGNQAQTSNAFKHRAFASEVILPGERESEFVALHRELIREWSPRGSIEDDAVATLAKLVRRTARERTSAENLLIVCLLMARPSQELEPPANPGRLSHHRPARAPRAGRTQGGTIEPPVDDLMEIGRHCAAVPLLDPRSPDDLIGYDESGLPR